ncbi:MAG: helix-turn-helix domain-containing protein [Pseudolabrys sp.]
MPKRQPNPIDCHVGSRVRMRRMMLAMSQEKLGNGLGLTFQQVQKYEKGTNRIGASRLQQIASILGVPVAFFFEGQPRAGHAPAGDVRTMELVTFTSSRDGLNLIAAFARIPDPKLRRAIVQLAEQAAASCEALAPPARRKVA